MISKKYWLIGYYGYHVGNWLKKIKIKIYITNVDVEVVCWLKINLRLNHKKNNK